VNGCRPRAAVIVGVITAGALYGGAGMALSVFASATPTDSGERAGAGIGAAARDRGNDVGSRGPRTRVAAQVQSAATAPGRRDRRAPAGPSRPPQVGPGGYPEGGVGEQWDCSHWLNVEPIRPPEPAATGNRGLFLLPGLVSVSTPVPQLTSGAAAEPPSTEVVSVRDSPAETGAPDGYAAGAGATPSPPASNFPLQIGVRRPAAAPLSGPPNRSSGPAVPRARMAAAPPPVSERLGYPEYLRHTDIAGLTSVALPGLAVIMSLTAIGTMVGYRQAKAGYLLRATGAGRFLP